MRRAPSRLSEHPTTVNDPEDTDITWTLSGTDADDFTINAGVLNFKNTPDFEAPTDSDRRNTYDVTVEATDEGGNTVSRRVRVTVTNEEEDGTVTLSHTQPEVRTSLTATLTDPDKERNVTWQWYRGGAADNRPCDSDSDRRLPHPDQCQPVYLHPSCR